MHKIISTALLSSSLALGLSTAVMANPEIGDEICRFENGAIAGNCTEDQARRLEAASLIAGPGRTVFSIDDLGKVREQYCNQCQDSDPDPEDPPIDVMPDPEEPSQDVPEPATVLSLLAIAGFSGLGLKRRA